MSIPTKNLKTGKTISFSGAYLVTFKNIFTSSLDGSIASGVDMELSTHGDTYEISLDLKQLTINHTKRAFANSPFRRMGEDYHWIPKYMIRPTKWGKAIFELNPQFILKLWQLVANDTKLRKLKGIGSPWKVTLPL